MKKLASIIALLGLAIPAYANEVIPLTASCKSLGANKEFLTDQYNEHPFAGGPSVIRLMDGKLVEGMGKIYVDPTGKGFTVLIEFVNVNKSCVLLMGDDFQPINVGNPT